MDKEAELADKMYDAGHIVMAEVHEERRLCAVADSYLSMGDSQKAAKFRREADDLNSGFYSHI